MKEIIDSIMEPFMYFTIGVFLLIIIWLIFNLIMINTPWYRRELEKEIRSLFEENTEE